MNGFVNYIVSVGCILGIAWMLWVGGAAAINLWRMFAAWYTKRQRAKHQARKKAMHAFHYGASAGNLRDYLKKDGTKTGRAGKAALSEVDYEQMEQRVVAMREQYREKEKKNGTPLGND